MSDRSPIPKSPRNRTCAPGELCPTIAVPSPPSPTGAARPTVALLGEVPCGLSHDRRQRAVEVKRERLGELVRLALRIVEDQ